MQGDLLPPSRVLRNQNTLSSIVLPLCKYFFVMSTDTVFGVTGADGVGAGRSQIVPVATQFHLRETNCTDGNLARLCSPLQRVTVLAKCVNTGVYQAAEHAPHGAGDAFTYRLLETNLDREIMSHRYRLADVPHQVTGQYLREQRASQLAATLFNFAGKTRNACCMDENDTASDGHVSLQVRFDHINEKYHELKYKSLILDLTRFPCTYLACRQSSCQIVRLTASYIFYLSLPDAS